MDRQKLLSLAQRHRGFLRFLFSLHNRFPFVNRWHGRLRTRIGLAYLKGCRISGGAGNTLIIEDYARLKNCSFHFEGTGNTVTIGARCYCANGDFWIEDNGNSITLGAHTYLTGEIHLSAIEGTAITVGKDCLFSGGIKIRTGDSHSLLDGATGKRINPSASVTIGDHVWVGTDATVLKGVSVADGCVVGAGALLCKKYETPNCVLAGVPAKPVRQNVDWTIERISGDATPEPPIGDETYENPLS